MDDRTPAEQAEQRYGREHSFAVGEPVVPGDSRLLSVVDLAQALAAARTSHDAVTAAATVARVALDGSMAAVARWEPERGCLRVLANVGELAPGEQELPRDETYSITDFPEMVSLQQRPANGRAALAWVETAQDPVADEWGHRRQRVAAMRRHGRSCWVVAPILLHGHAWGELVVARTIGQPQFDQADVEFAGVLATLTAAGLAQVEELERTRRLAFTDPLTGLGNRRAVDARLDEALERHHTTGSMVSLAICDLNGLKRVNDAFGHEAGDRLLTGFADQLALCAAMLPDSLAARLGGDEFCLVTEGYSVPEVVRVAEEVCRRARQLPLGNGAACGVACTGAGTGLVTTPARLFRLADAAQYHAKAIRASHPVVADRRSETAAPPLPEGERRRFRGARGV